ncbi:hypothetical protein GGR56DRAFT_348797 [Xylariaceae sp. FL0804]|nr:hypothetical protein GGR56DRAFT_348797 [Xylariaceae sp. FL0804]
MSAVGSHYFVVSAVVASVGSSVVAAKGGGRGRGAARGGFSRVNGTDIEKATEGEENACCLFVFISSPRPPIPLLSLSPCLSPPLDCRH